MSKINPYTITFVVVPRIIGLAHRVQRERTRWLTFIEAYTAEDALTQFKAGTKTYLHNVRFDAFLGHLYVESIEPGLPRCPKCGAAMEHRTGLPRESLRCVKCNDSAIFPRNLGEAK